MRIHQAHLGGLALLLAALVAALHIAHATALRNVLAAVAVLWVLVRFASDRASPPLAWPLLAWLAWGVLSALWSLDAETSLKSAIYDIAMPAGAFYGTYLVSRDIAAFRFLVFAVIAGMAALAMLAVLAFLVGRAELLLTHEPGGLLYLYPGPGAASTLGIFAMPLALLLFESGRRQDRRLAGALVAIIVVAALLTQNRMFWPAAVITVAVYYLGQLPRLSPLQRKRLRIAGYVGIVAAVTIVATLSKARTQVFEARLQGWEEWAAIAAERPWIGYGLGKKVVAEVGPTRLTLEMRRTDPAFIWHAHNLVLNTTLQVGVLGLGLFLLLLGALGGYGYLRGKDRTTPESAALLALLVGMLIKNTPDDFMDHAVVIAFWAHAGMLLGRVFSFANPEIIAGIDTNASHPQ